MRQGRAPALAAIVLLALSGMAATPGTASPRPAILFDDQHTSGRIVLVDAVRLPDAGFVAVHDPTEAEGDGLGPVLGSSTLLDPGEHTMIPVNVHRKITQQTTLIAALYQDTNENGNFDAGDGHGHHDHAGQDEPYMDGNATIGDRAQVGPTPEPKNSSTLNPLVIGASLAIASVALWATRYR